MAPRVIRRLLVPNRGEIAVRIARACRESGVESVLAHAEDDFGLLARREFDDAVSLGPGDGRGTYLDAVAVIDAARRAGCDAIHPGYGFLSERAELASACLDAGIIFVGPKPDSIALMGSKAESRMRMKRAGVPVVPGYDGDDQADQTLLREGAAVGFPLLVKASAGGGGKGMRIVRKPDELLSAVQAARREAEKSFGDARLLLEHYIDEPRHVEFQIFGDADGHVVHLFERDCSVQRRHQKVIEETPAPNYPEDLRAAMSRAAVTAATAVGYVNAGTVEFIVTPDMKFYFLEMNTRLQVEHPITEEVTGVDLVRAQFHVAAGGALPWRQEDLRQRGHAIEARVYAEDPDQHFLPQTGTIAVYREPAGPGVRVDSGVAAGSEVSVHYDPLLAKVICHAESRDRAIERVVRALGEYVILGTTTNLGYLRRIVGHPAFQRGDVSTHFIERHSRELARSTDGAAAIAIAISSAKPSVTNAARPTIRPSVWDAIGPWGR